MECDKFKPLLMEYLDGELDREGRQRVERHLAECSACCEELDSMQKMKNITSSMQLTQPEDEVWKMYWNKVYNRIERGLGWILLSIGAIILMAFGAFQFVQEFLKDSSEPLWVKIGVSALLLGVIILFVSVMRERLFIRKTEKYKEILR
ncbi:MAG TPA: zf-HC2 domain-containing protein [archaeon]|nr:zf-HC2 domain-containing protein [archaeon]